MATITDPIILDTTGKAIADAILALGNNANLKGEKGDKGDKGDDGYPFLIYKQYDDISEFSADDFPETGLMFMIMTAVPDNGYPVYRYDASEDPPYSFITYLQSEAIKGEKGDKGDTGDTYTPVIGTVTTLPMGSAATARIELDTVNKKAKYSFGLPQSGVDDKIYRGSKADFAALSQEEQDEYTIRFFTDDGVATYESVGVIKPDNTTTMVEDDGTLHSVIKDKEYIQTAVFTTTAAELMSGTVEFESPITGDYYVDVAVKAGNDTYKLKISSQDDGKTFNVLDILQFTILDGSMDENGFDYEIATPQYNGQVTITFSTYTLTTADELNAKINELESTVADLESTTEEPVYKIKDITVGYDENGQLYTNNPITKDTETAQTWDIPENCDILRVEILCGKGDGVRSSQYLYKIIRDTSQANAREYWYVSASDVGVNLEVDWTVTKTIKLTGNYLKYSDDRAWITAYIRQ